MDFNSSSMANSPADNTGSMLKFKTWNIDGKNFGKKRGEFGDKLEHKDFLAEIENYDVVTLVETHAFGMELRIPGFHKPIRKDRPISKNGKKSFGGIAVFVRKELWDKKIITERHNTSEDCIWLKISKNFVNGGKDIFVGAIYLPPPNKWNKSKINDRVKIVMDEIEKFSRKGEVLLSGDLNARTNNDLDYVCLSADFDPHDNNPPPIRRNSEDRKMSCKRGKDILQLCKILDIMILNGRKIGDSFGQMTCFRWNGCSVVDYGMCSRDLFENCIIFKVGELLPHISDHCPIVIHLSLNLVFENNSIDFTLQDSDRGLFWTVDSAINLKETLNREEFQQGFQSINVTDDNIQENIQSLNALIMQACIDSEIKYCRDSIRRDNKPWFDKECVTAKLSLKRETKCVRREPHNILFRERFASAKREYKKCLRQAKSRYECQTLEKVSNVKEVAIPEFWKTANKLRKPKDDSLKKIPPKEIYNHFSQLLQTKASDLTVIAQSDQGPLDNDITKEELERVMCLIKYRKSTGPDRISNEILEVIYDAFPDLFLRLFNNILSNGIYPKNWSISYLVPIHKKGSKFDIRNYRGICLMSCLGKAFSKILNNRLIVWLEGNGVLSPEQLGFVTGNRTSDAHIMLYNLIQKYCKKGNKRLYTCFIDFEKAFDKICRSKLLIKMKSLGITGKFLNIIAAMYSGDQVQIKLGNKVTGNQFVNSGVRQGCVLSPTLFNIFYQIW